MKNSKMFVMTAGMFVAGALTSVAGADFGTLSYGSTPISFVWGSGIPDNTGFVYTNSAVSGKTLAIGLRTSAYFDIANGAPTNDGVNTYTVNAGTTLWAPPAGSTDPQYASYSASAPRWQFNWSVSMDGQRTAAALAGLNWAMRITGPGGTWGYTAAPGADLGTAGNAAAYSQDSWQMGYNYLQVDSANTPNVGFPGLWTGLAFNPNQIGTYSVQIAVHQSGTLVGSTTMFVNVVPAPSALALLGVAGLAGSRRRRA